MTYYNVPTTMTNTERMEWDEVLVSLRRTPSPSEVASPAYMAMRAEHIEELSSKLETVTIIEEESWSPMFGA